VLYGYTGTGDTADVTFGGRARVPWTARPASAALLRRIIDENEVITVTPIRTFPVIRDLVTDASFNYAKAREIPSFAPPTNLKPGEYLMQQVDVERSQEFRKCIECIRCQNTCHVLRDHEDNEESPAT
jgi:succinate dehydrogenase/fumarate reductase-like Fe-S protein